ncbi:hypothetical protein LTR56_020558 [Elasticomyces elasticus]|nr:hypothetical protein LTR56_020558 [Elasticomyces elasticus]KAK3655834.1 hypothetical protein LTR22_010129 [Elasticomyces elasticus]KAK4925827.1 hypothetical protein LTR49_007203 [Elasticomyces elasticus]KAK5764780.1 hypothetical protein LTS12_005049 [Elasticomyces elasticus]
MPTIPQAEIDRVALVKAELWPANVVFNDYRPDAMYVALGNETVRCLRLPNLPRGSGMVYACREDSVYTRLIKANERSKESGTESGRVLMLARLTELVRILPAALHLVDLPQPRFALRLVHSTQALVSRTGPPSYQHHTTRSMASTSSGSLATLHNELLLDTASYLNLRDLSRFSQVCTRFRRFIHYHDRTLLEPLIDEERQRLRGQIDGLDLGDMPVLAALRKFAAVQVQTSATCLHQEFAAQCFTHFYRRSNISTHYSQSELFALLWTTFPASQLRLEYVPGYLRAGIAQVRFAAKVMPFWPSDMTFTNDNRDVEYVALNILDADSLGLPSAGLSRNLVYACRGKSADRELGYAYQKMLATEESDPGAHRLTQARLLERTTILPLDMFLGCQMDELRGWDDRQTVRLVPSLGRSADETA